MGSLSIWHWLIVLAVGLLLFGGRGKISDLMGDVAKGIKSFKKGMAEDPEADASPPKSIEPPGDPKRRVDTASKIETLS
jgi:sec-independent protein translocase protein TatA